MNKNLLRQILIVAAVAATIAINGLANALPLNGQTTGEISDRFPVFFTPAGYVFSIWGVIYLGLIGYAGFQALRSQRDNPRLRSIGGLFLLSSAANIAWIFLWHYEQYPLTLPVMLVLLGSLIGIYLKLRQSGQPSPAERWLVRLPFSIYLGWVTVATVANTTTLLSYLNWNGFGIQPEIWTAIILAVASLIGGLVFLTRRDTAFLLVLTWAFAGILAKHSTVPLVAISAGIAAGLMAVLALAAALPTRRGPASQADRTVGAR